MPKQTFYNISNEKRQNLIDIGIKLFSTMNYETVEVKSIVEMANIPRGSFYAYFEDISDYYLTIIHNLQVRRITMIEELSLNFIGSLFDFLIKLFEIDIKESTKSSRKLLLYHYFRYVQTQKLGLYDHVIYYPKNENNVYQILSKLYLNENSSEVDIAFMVEYLMSIYLLTYTLAIDRNLSLEDSVSLFTKRIQIIERGLIKWFQFFS